MSQSKPDAVERPSPITLPEEAPDPIPRQVSSNNPYSPLSIGSTADDYLVEQHAQPVVRSIARRTKPEAGATESPSKNNAAANNSRAPAVQPYQGAEDLDTKYAMARNRIFSDSQSPSLVPTESVDSLGSGQPSTAPSKAQLRGQDRGGVEYRRNRALENQGPRHHNNRHNSQGYNQSPMAAGGPPPNANSPMYPNPYGQFPPGGGGGGPQNSFAPPFMPGGVPPFPPGLPGMPFPPPVGSQQRSTTPPKVGNASGHPPMPNFMDMANMFPQGFPPMLPQMQQQLAAMGMSSLPGMPPMPGMPFPPGMSLPNFPMRPPGGAGLTSQSGGPPMPGGGSPSALAPPGLPYNFPSMGLGGPPPNAMHEGGGPGQQYQGMHQNERGRGRGGRGRGGRGHGNGPQSSYQQYPERQQSNFNPQQQPQQPLQPQQQYRYQGQQQQQQNWHQQQHPQHHQQHQQQQHHQQQSRHYQQQLYPSEGELYYDYPPPTLAHQPTVEPEGPYDIPAPYSQPQTHNPYKNLVTANEGAVLPQPPMPPSMPQGGDDDMHGMMELTPEARYLAGVGPSNSLSLGTRAQQSDWQRHQQQQYQQQQHQQQQHQQQQQQQQQRGRGIQIPYPAHEQYPQGGGGFAPPQPMDSRNPYMQGQPPMPLPYGGSPGGGYLQPHQQQQQQQAPHQGGYNEHYRGSGGSPQNRRGGRGGYGQGININNVQVGRNMPPGALALTPTGSPLGNQGSTPGAEPLSLDNKSFGESGNGGASSQYQQRRYTPE